MSPDNRRRGTADTPVVVGIGHNNPPAPIDPPVAPVPRYGFTIPEFCASHGIGVTKFYQLRKKGLAPRTMKGLGRREIVTIEESARWRQMMTEGVVEAAEITT